MGIIDALNELFKLDITALIMGIFILLACVISIYEITKKVCEIFKIPVKWFKGQNEDHELLLKNDEKISELAKIHEEDEKKQQKQNEEIDKKLNDLTNIVIKKEINDSRWTILDFSSALSNGREYNREAFNHIFTIYHDYESILKEHGMTNGLVDESMEFIRDKYQELLRNGKL